MESEVLPSAPPLAPTSVPFAQNIAAYGDRPAVIGTDGTELTYRELAARVHDTAQRLGAHRRLIMISARNDVDSLVGYLAALTAGHPALLTSADDRETRERLISTYDPDVVLCGTNESWDISERRPGTIHSMHPELALLLSTSGSTGSPKLVRLSAENLHSNAEAIASYLEIRDTDRAIASLPMHYCYGLSVINSNLLRGAALILTEHSVVDDEFWTVFHANGATSLHGVPYTFDLLDRIGFDRLALPSLRYVTQAGGTLSPQRVLAYAELASRAGWQFFVMYGQTEATARMAYLPPELARDNPAAIGVPIPGGKFEIRSTGAPDEGELIYHGPNVMLGYAEEPSDLALGRTVRSLATGDLARKTPSGMYQVIGRRSRFLKLFGLRVDLQQVEQRLTTAGHTVACTGDDETLVIAAAGTGQATAIRRLVTSQIGVPASSIGVVEFRELPRLASGKIDYPAITNAARESGPQEPVGSGAEPASVRELFARALGTDVQDEDTFVTLGGDSLSYVRTSAQLEKLLGHLPRAWPNMPVRELDAQQRRKSMLTTVETDVALRAIAITLVVGTHVGLFAVMGGAHLLLILAGWSFARFVLPDVTGNISARILRSALWVAIPAMLWLASRMVFANDIGIANVLLVNNYLQTNSGRGYWFVETLVHILVMLAVVFAIPAMRRLERRHGMAFAVGAFVCALFVQSALVDRTSEFPEYAFSAHGVAWLFLLGWLAKNAAALWHKVVISGVATTLLIGYFGEPLRELVIAAGLIILLSVPSVKVPKFLAHALGLIASASLYIYLTHYAIYPTLLSEGMHPGVVLVISIGVGIGSWLIVDRSVCRIRPVLTGSRSRPPRRALDRQKP